MTNSTLTAGLARRAAPLLGLLLFAACNEQPSSSPSTVRFDGAEPRELRACVEPELKPIEGAAAMPTTLPVAYPGGDLQRPLRLARAFPLADPQVPLPRVLRPKSVVRDVRPLTDESDDALPPVVVMEQSPLFNPPPRAARVTATFVSKPSREAAAPPRPPAPPRLAASSRPMASLPRAPRRSDAMLAVNQQAEQMIRRGYHLAERGALYSARAEFVQALRTISQALDLQSGSRDHTQALSAGLTALEEAEDFVPEGARLESDLDLATLIRAHRTPACKELETGSLLPVTVLQHYYTYAQEQLAVAAGGEEAASMALFGLGKTYSTLAIEKSLSAPVAEPKAMVFHWAALSAHSGNFLAANELAVLEARWGQFPTARSLLQYSLAVAPHSAVWRNLATVHQRLGETKLAELALREADWAADREATAKPDNPAGIVPSSDVKWLDSKAFAATARSEIDSQKPAPAEEKSPAVKATPVVAPAPPRQRSAAAWFPWFR